MSRGIPKRAAKRDKNEKEIIDALAKTGATVVQLSSKGVPDLLVGYRDQNFLLEIKTEDGKLTDDQKTFSTRWRGQVTVVRNPGEALYEIGAIDNLDQ